MSDTSRNSDQEIKSGITAIKDGSGDSGITTTDQDVGWHAERMVEYVTTSFNGARHIKRDKEYSFRPHFAKAVHDAVNYRDFREPPGAPAASPSGNNTVALDDNTLLVGQQPGVGGSGLAADWVVGAEQVGMEFSLISDTINFLKSKPDFNPFHPNGRNQSTMIVSKDERIGADDDVDLPRRYFGRAHDMIIPRQTQDVKLKRVEFTPKGNYFNKKTRATKDYQDAFYKAMWNISPFEQPFEGTLKQQSEHVGDMTGGRHGFSAHDYASAIDSELIILVPPVFQGGWMVDTVLDVAGQIHDVLGIGKGTRYERYVARDGKKVNLVYMRHDAMFSKFPTQKGRFHFLGFEEAIEPVGIPFWADHVMDGDKKGLDTNLDEPPPRTKHEDGQWRVRFRFEFPPRTPPEVPTPDNPRHGEVVVPQPPSDGGPGLGDPVPTPCRRFEPGEYEARTFKFTEREFMFPWDSGEIAYEIRVPVMAIPPNFSAAKFADLALAFRSQPDCPVNASPPFVELPAQRLDNTFLSDKGFCTVVFEISSGHIEDHAKGSFEFTVSQLSTSDNDVALLMGHPATVFRPPGFPTTKKAPDLPASLDQLDTGLSSIPAGGSTSDILITFEAVITDPDAETVALEIEVIPVARSFESTPIRRGGFVASGSTAQVGLVLAAATTYHWRARVLNLSGVVSDWVAFADPSFTIT